MMKAAGLTPSQLWPPQNTRHYKWVPAFAGMKRSGGDAKSSGVTVSQVMRFLCLTICFPGLNKNAEIRAICAIRVFGLILCSLLYNGSAISSSAATVFVFLFGFLSFGSIFHILLFECSIFSFILSPCFSVSLCFQTFIFGFYPKSDIRKGYPSMVKPNPLQHTLSRVFHIPGTAGIFGTVYCTYFISAVHRERTGKCTLFRSHSRSGRRGRMQRHMRDNMASRGRDNGKLRSRGSDIWTLLPMVQLPLSSPGVFTNPPLKPTGKFYKPNRQWCGAPRGGGEGSPRVRVSFEQQKRTRCNPSALFAPVADRQQQARSSAHRRAASSTARTRVSRIMDLLDMKKRHDFHIREDQQNMGTGNAFFQRCLYPFLRSRTFFNRPITPFCKTVRAGVAY